MRAGRPHLLSPQPAPEGQGPLPPERRHHHIAHPLVAALLAQRCAAKQGWKVRAEMRQQLQNGMPK